MRITVDQNLCIGDGSCVMLAGKTFKLNREGKCYVLVQDDTPETTNDATLKELRDAREDILEAARACPVQAIKLFEDDGTEITL